MRKKEKDIIKKMRNEYNLTCSIRGILSNLCFFTKYFYQMKIVAILLLAAIIDYFFQLGIVTFYFVEELSLSYFFEHEVITIVSFGIILIIVEYLVLFFGEYLLKRQINKRIKQDKNRQYRKNSFFLKFLIIIN